MVKKKSTKKKAKKVALITGVTGQDGSYLAELLLSKGYEVHGIKRSSSSLNTQRIDHLFKEWYEKSDFRLHYGDLTDSSSLSHVIEKTNPDEIYNLAAQSHVQVSFEEPEYTANSDALGVLRILECIRTLGLGKKTRFYQASTSEIYGNVQEIPQRETTPFYPRSPYGVAKIYGYWITINYREAYNLFACNGILFNHESPRRGEIFVTRKITQGLAKVLSGISKKIILGNLDAERDWGHSRDYVEGMWKMLQINNPMDLVLATGKTTSIREFIRRSFQVAGVTLEFKGNGIKERGIVAQVNPSSVLGTEPHDLKIKSGDTVIMVHPKYFRPTEVDQLIGDARKARKILNWKPKTDLDTLIQEMVQADWERLSFNNRI